jgi:DNA polymerase I-like protein with 3'-5' exonuclease and polymerase domains
VVVPDPGTYFIKWDWSAIEAKLAAAYSGDDEDLDLFARGADIHTVTYCKMYRYPLPPNLMNPHTSSECEAWRAQVNWQGKNGWQRSGAKISRYNLAYGVDERSIHASPAAAQLAREAGMDKKQLEAVAKAYLDSKPKLKAWKRKVWGQIMATHEVRTPLGRRKRLFVTTEEYTNYKRTGRAGSACKEGLNHLAQGQVAGMMNRTIIAIKQRWPCSRLAFQAHDGHLSVWPESVNPWPEIREVVEREWDCGNGRSIKSTADWERINSDGTHEDLR